jgi:hypothetical protein
VSSILESVRTNHPFSPGTSKNSLCELSGQNQVAIITSSSQETTIPEELRLHRTVQFQQVLHRISQQSKEHPVSINLVRHVDAHASRQGRFQRPDSLLYLIKKSLFNSIRFPLTEVRNDREGVPILF